MTTTDTVVIGLGNPLRGDDGVGVRIIELLAERDLPAGVEVVDGGTQGLGIVPLLQGRRRVVLIDAADMGREPGHYVRFTPEEARLLGNNQRIAIHEARLRDALVLADALQVLPEQVIIFGVQPANLEWDAALSPEVEAVLSELTEAVFDEIVGNGEY